MTAGKDKGTCGKSETYTSAISLLDNIKLLCYFIIMDDTKLRYLIDSSRGGVTFSDLLEKST